ncbi:MAG: ThuA domain-containing protein [Candidatus Hydrogenedentota bacterium]
MNATRPIIAGILASAAFCATHAVDPWVVYEGGDGAGKGKHVVIVTGDDEYRSEESMPPFGKILAARHGFKVTVLFAINPETGAIAPEVQNNIPGLDALDNADLMILFTRFRDLPDEQMKRIIDYTDSGRPIMALRTATHAFFFKNAADPNAKWSWNSKDPKGGYGREVLGETWVNHYGNHKAESTRGVIAEGMKDSPLVRGCEDIWGPSDVYGITTLSGDSNPVVMGQVLKGMNPDDAPNAEKPMVPVAWIKSYTGTSGKPSRVFTTTMGHSFDLKSEGFRRLLVNAVYWGLGMEDVVPPRANVDFIGEYAPADIGFGTNRVGVMPSEHVMK